MTTQVAQTADITLTSAVSPSGLLLLVPADADEPIQALDAGIAVKLLQHFEHSTFAGLTFLASSDCDGPLPASLKFWRGFAESYFRAICRQQSRDTSVWSSPQPLDEESLLTLLESAPPMRGLEYLSPDSLKTIWRGLDSHTCERVADCKLGLAGYLHQLNEAWNLIGRVTFHLAENKKDEQRPFAFLATYSDSQSAGGTPRHVPLAEALKQSVATKDAQLLEKLLEPVQRASQSSEVVKQLLDSRALFSPQAWSIRQAFEFLSQVPQMEEAGIIVRVPNWWNASRPPRPQVNVRIGTKNKSTLGIAEALDFQVDIALDGQPLDADELKQLLAAREGMTLLRGKWVQVDQQRLQDALQQWKELQKQHVKGLSFLEGLRMLSGASIGGIEVDDELRSWTRIEPGQWLQETLNTLRDPSGIIQLDPGNRLRATLRPYQVDGVRWLWFTTRLGLGACLADDMGLGKTIQVISLLLQLKYPQELEKGHVPSGRRDEPDSQPSLLIVPTSLLGNWKREVERFGPDLRLFIAHRSQSDVETLRRVAEDPQRALAGYDLVATSYGLARRDDWLAKMRWKAIILDEAQAIKNAGASQTKSIKNLESQSRIVLTGTPVENHLGDLWSLFDFCSPGLLGSATQFKRFVKDSNEKGGSKSLAALRRLIRPYVMRRLKTDPLIAPDLPDKTEMRVDCGLTATQASLYQQVIEELENILDKATGIQRRGIVLAVLMQLKQICNHPALYLKQANFRNDLSGKYTELATICEIIIEKQEKLLVFTQFQSMCDPLHDFLESVFGRAGLVLTGKTAASKRNKLVEEFQQESGPPYFVISVKAGGTGLNLTQASHVVHFDRWWNPAVEDQATDRAFRIGQKRNVLVHKFVCRGTLEERIDQLIEDKKAISRELFSEDGQINLTEMSNEQLLKFVSLDLTKASEL